MADRTLRIKLLANTDSYKAEMQRASRLGSDYFKSTGNSSQRLTNYINQNTNAFSGLNKNIQIATNTLKNLGGAFIGGFAVSSIANVADNYGQMAQRIKNSLQAVEGDISNYEMVQNRLLETSIRNAKDLADSQELYIRSAESMKTLGYTTSQTIDFVESLSSAFTSNATSSEQVKSSINALNKAFVSGKVSAQQWETLTAALPNLAGQIATSLGKSRDEIVKLGNAGKLSITQLANGTIQAKDAFNALADSMDNTIKDGITQLSNAFQHWVGEANQANKVTATVASGMTYLAKNFDYVVDAGGALLALQLARYFGGLTSSLSSSTLTMAKNVAQVREQALAQKLLAEHELREIELQRIQIAQSRTSIENRIKLTKTVNSQILLKKALNKLEAEEIALNQRSIVVKNNLAAANTRASLAANALTKASSLLKSGIGLLGGPVGAAMLAGGALYYFSQKSAEAREQTTKLKGSVNDLVKEYEKLSDLQLEIKQLELEKKIKKQNEYIDTQRIAVSQLAKTYEDFSDSQQLYSWGAVSDNSLEIKKEEQALIDMNNKLVEQQDELKEIIKLRERIANGYNSKDNPSSNNLPDNITLPADTSAYDDQKKRLDDLKKSLDSLSSPLEKQKSLYEANNKTIQDSLKAGIINKEKADKKLEELEQNHQLAMAKIRADNVVSNTDQAIAQVDPIKALENENAKKLALIQEYENQKLLTEQQALALREAQNYEFEQNRIAAQWEIWSKQSEANEFLAASLDGLASSATSTISGLMSGTMNATEAMQNFANVILNQAIGSLVQMGLQQVQNAIIGQAAAQASTAAQIAEATSLTSAYTAAAIQASIATQGAAATIGQSAYLTAMATMNASALTFGGGRERGGTVLSNSLYQVGEKDKPELLSIGGRQYMIPGDNGTVFSNKEITGNSRGGNNVNINVNVPVNIGDNSLSESDGKQLGKMIEQVVCSKIQEQQRPGGLLDKR